MLRPHYSYTLVDKQKINKKPKQIVDYSACPYPFSVGIIIFIKVLLLVFYCCGTYLHKYNHLKQCTLVISVSASQKCGHCLPQFSELHLPRPQSGYNSYPEGQLKKNLISSSLLTEFIFWRQYGGGSELDLFLFLSPPRRLLTRSFPIVLKLAYMSQRLPTVPNHEAFFNMADHFNKSRVYSESLQLSYLTSEKTKPPFKGS